ncbi:MAG: CDP-alcohol phosphatidyltransferase family protein [Firmicutes bacterium]|nr:CDP-alcohol phosphatidyltransferase family protein [Bacillota bacterium]MCM1478032.1 CDP-alcohol phosphatidyltransferase family protein [Bacteroides sp.]
MSIVRKSIPNFITCLNLLSGALACIFAFHYQEMFGSLQGYQVAFLFIGAAAVFDFCDGASARMLHSYSDLGKELDSLSDLVSFGLAPGLILFNTINLFNTGSALTLSPWAFVALIIPVLGALRLAKFNIDTRQTTYFIGLPIPACAIFWIGLVGWLHRTGAFNNYAIAAVTVLMALMMVSNVRMFSLKFKNFRFKENLRRYAIILAAIVFVVSDGVSGLAWTIIFYILVSAVTRRYA